MVARRWMYLLLIALNVPAGLALRWFAGHLPELVATYAGDVLAASCIYFGVRFLFVRWPIWRVSLIAYLICIAIETFQLYQADWIVELRSIPWIAVLLGQGFLWSDWICYAAGVGIGAMFSLCIEMLVRWKRVEYRDD